MSSSHRKSRKNKNRSQCPQRQPDTVTGTMKLRIDLPSSSGTAKAGHHGSNEAAPGLLPNIVQMKNVLNEEVNVHEERARARTQELNTVIEQLRTQIQQHRNDLDEKSTSLNRLQSDLNVANETTNNAKAETVRLQQEIVTFTRKNVELAEQLQTKTNECQQLTVSVNSLIKQKQQLETLNNSNQERNDLENEKKRTQERIENILKEKERMEKKWQEEYEKLRTVNASREQQLLDDFEWKLREVQQTCKKRIDEQNQSVQQKLSDVDLCMKKAQQQMNEVVHLRSYEAEVTQLRGLTHDQQHSLRTMSARVEQLQLTEQNIKEEVNQLHGAVETEKARYAELVKRHEKELADKERACLIRLERQRGDVAVQWEQKLRQECARLQNELEQMHADDKQLALELLKVQLERDLQQSQLQHNQDIEGQLKELASVRNELTQKEQKFQVEMERMQTNTDRDVIELRREIDKTEMLYHDRIEKLLEKHEHELEQLQNESDRRVKEMEQNSQMQTSSMRVTLELVKEQMEREHQDAVQNLTQEQQRLYDEQWHRLTDEKNMEIQRIENEYEYKINKMVAEKPTECNYCQMLAKELDEQQTYLDTLNGGVQILSQELVQADQKVKQLHTEADQKNRELQFTLQLERNKHGKELAYVKKQSHLAIEELRKKYQYLTKLFKEKQLSQSK